MLQKIKAGISTWCGIISSVVLLVPPFVSQAITFIENNQSHFSGAEKTSAITGGALLAVTMLGRFAQAVAAILKKPPTVQFTPPTAAHVDTGRKQPVDLARELLTEQPEIIQQLKSENVIT